MSQLGPDEDTEESYQSWVQHEHTRKRAAAQREEVKRLIEQLHMVGLASEDPKVRHVSVQLQDALAFQKVFEGKK
jgi:hypothetical protein